MISYKIHAHKLIQSMNWASTKDWIEYIVAHSHVCSYMFLTKRHVSMYAVKAELNT